MTRLFLVVPILCATTCASGACSNSNQLPSAPSSATVTTAATSVTTSGASAAKPLANVNPCSLLTPTQLPQHQLGQGAYSAPADGVRQCEWQRLNTSSGAVDTSAYILSAAIYDKTSLRNINETNNTTEAYDHFGQHQALLAKNTNSASNTCEVQISASDSTTLTISVDPLVGNIEYACTIVEQAAPVLVANLPANW
jgi:hypothetical protein